MFTAQEKQAWFELFTSISESLKLQTKAFEQLHELASIDKRRLDWIEDDFDRLEDIRGYLNIHSDSQSQ